MNILSIRSTWWLLHLILLLFITTTALRVNAQKEKKHSPDLAAKALGVSTHKKHEHTQEQAKLARAIGKEVVCLCGTCPKRKISDCECGWALQNQVALVNAVVEGKSSEQIIETYRKVYGDQVLAMLPNEGFARTAWALPYGIGIAALIITLFLGLKFMKQPSTVTALTEEDSAALPQVTDDEEARATLARELEDLD